VEGICFVLAILAERPDSFIGFAIMSRQESGKSRKITIRLIKSVAKEGTLPKKTASMEPIVTSFPIPAFTSYFKAVCLDVLDLLGDSNAEAFMLATNAAFGPISAPTVITRENIGNMTEYLPRQDDSKGFTSLIQR
jgi:hypothetical protein